MKIIYLLSFMLWAMSCSNPKNSPKLDLLVGTYTGSGSDGIYLLSFDEASGTLSEPSLVAEITNPSFLTITPDRKYVYSVGEGDGGKVTAFRWEADKQLTLINQVSSMGANPCYVDFKGGLVAVANYSSGNGALYTTGADGSLGADPSVFQHSGTGPNTSRQEAPHAHFSQFSKDGRFVYVVDLGIDQVLAYPVIDGRLDSATVALNLQPGDGPRHLAFHPDKDFVFVVNELSNTVTSASVNTETGAFTVIDRESTLPKDFTEHSQCADIHISKDGKFLYASNRGHHSIAIYAVGEDATLTLLGIEPSRGEWPRNFTFSPDEKFLIVANQNTNNVVVFARDEATGLLTFTGNEVAISKPVCLRF